MLDVDNPFLINLVCLLQNELRLYFVMPFINGGELFRICKKKKRLDEETIKFYSTITENWVWENSDIIITSNPKLLEKKIEGKVLIKYETTYNVESYSDYTIKTLEEFKELYKTLKLKQDD